MHSNDAELHSLILRNMAEGICLLRVSDLTIVYANPRFEQIFGYDPGELNGQPVSILNYAANEAGAMEVARTIIAEIEREGVGTYEVHNRKKDGTPFWCRARTSHFVHPEFGPVWVAVQTDITAEKEAIERLRRHEKLLNAVFEAIPVGLWIADAGGQIVANNPAASRIWGGERRVGIDQFGEYQAWRVDTGEQLDAESWGLARAIQRGETALGELLRIHGFDGVERTILNSVIPLRDGDAIVGAIAVNEDVTRLKEAEALSAGVIAAAPDALVATDGERRIIVFNTGAERIFGHTRDEVLGQDIGRLIALNHRDALEDLLAAADAGEREPRMLIGCRRTGEVFPAEVSAACTRNGTLRRYTLVLRDITARLRADDERARLAHALADERSWLRALISSAPVGISTLDTHGGFHVNPHGEALSGVRNGRGEREAYVSISRRPDESPLTLADLPLSRVLRGESVQAEEYLLLRPDGTRRSILGSARAVHGAHGELLGAIGIYQDITGQKQLEGDLRFFSEAGRALAESLDFEATMEKIARLAVPQLADGCVIYILDDAGEIHPSAFHCVPADALPTLAALLHRGPLLGLTRGAAKVARTGQPALRPSISADELVELAQGPEHLEGLQRLGLGSYVTAPLRARATTLGAITLFGTTTGRSVGERELRLLELLAPRAALALDNARLYRGAQRATQARDDVLAIVAHDLRNPVGAILLAIETAARCLQPGIPAGLRAADAIRRCATQINRLIDDLLDAARIEAGTLALVRGPVAPADLVTEAVEAARPLADGVELRADIAPGLPLISADPGRLLQVLGNLLGNAVKFTPSGGRIVVSAARVGDDLELRIADTGRGLPPEEREHVFDRFWQADRTDRRGAGLGLAIVKGIVEAHGGAVRVEGAAGAGAVFVVALPLASPPA